jgi:hypothetical protein
MIQAYLFEDYLFESRSNKLIAFQPYKYKLLKKNT